MTRGPFAPARTLLVLGCAGAALLVGSGAAAGADGNHPPNWCFRANASGELPTCTWDGTAWHRSFDSAGSGTSGTGAFAVFFVLALVVGIGFTVWKVSTARRMAGAAGMSTSDATAMTLLTDDGFEATYLASNLRGRTAPPAQVPTTTTASTAERLRELGELRDQGLITPDEYDARRRIILDSL